MNTVKINKNSVKMVAHRGVSGLERENTNAAFVAAGNRSYFGIDLDIYHEAVTKELVKKLHENGIEINCWTVDNPEQAEKLASFGVDYITSNILE